MGLWSNGYDVTFALFLYARGEGFGFKIAFLLSQNQKN